MMSIESFLFQNEKINKEMETQATIVGICGPEKSSGVPHSYRGTSGVSFLVEIDDRQGDPIEVNCEHHIAELRSTFGSDNAIIGSKCIITSRGNGDFE